MSLVGYGAWPGARDRLDCRVDVLVAAFGILALLLFISSGLRDAFDPNTIREAQTPRPPHKK